MFGDSCVMWDVAFVDLYLVSLIQRFMCFSDPVGVSLEVIFLHCLLISRVFFGSG